MPNSIRTFDKPPSSFTDLISKLKSCGLIIADEQSAIHYLKHINYFRLRGYGIPFEVHIRSSGNPKKFKPETKFEDLISAHKTDTVFRGLLLEAIEVAEIAIRSVINHEIGTRYNNSHWFLDEAIFKTSVDFNHSSFLRQIKLNTAKNADSGSDKEKRREPFIQHYYNCWDEPEYPPFWMLAEVMSLGSWSKVYEHLARQRDAKNIAREFDLSPAIMTSWMHSLTFIRNLCAHQARLFGRTFPLPPKLGKNAPLLTQNNLFNYFVIAYWFVRQVQPDLHFLDKLDRTLNEIDEKLWPFYGFQKNWLDNEYWIK